MSSSAAPSAPAVTADDPHPSLLCLLLDGRAHSHSFVPQTLLIFLFSYLNLLKNNLLFIIYITNNNNYEIIFPNVLKNENKNNMFLVSSFEEVSEAFGSLEGRGNGDLPASADTSRDLGDLSRPLSMVLCGELMYFYCY